MLVDSKLKLHRNISAILVDESLNSVDSAILTASKLCAFISGCFNAILAAVFQLRRARFEIKDLVETSKVLRTTTSPLGFNISTFNCLPVDSARSSIFRWHVQTSPPGTLEMVSCDKTAPSIFSLSTAALSSENWRDFLELPRLVNSSSGFPGRLFPFWRSGVTVVGSSHLLVHSCKSLSSVSLPVAESLLQVTAVWINLYNSNAFLILWPQDLQTRSDTLWLLINGNPIDKQQSSNTVPGLSFLADFENKFSKDALVSEFSKEHEQNLQWLLHPPSFFHPRFELFVGVADISTLNFWLSRSENFSLR